jgi:hypothetical protein
LADWLNSLRNAALERQRLLETVVPQDFRDCAIAHVRDPADARGRVPMPARSSVIERRGRGR